MNRQNEEIEIDLFELIRVFWSKALVIILVALLAASAAFGITFFFITPTYEATASFYINNSSISIGSASYSISSGELSASNSLVQTYIYILKSRTTLEDVLDQCGAPYTYIALEKMLSTESVQNTAAFSVTVKSKSPTEAELIANTIASVLPARITEIVDGSNARIIDYAIVPTSRSGPSYAKNTAIGLLAGAFLAMLVIFTKYMIAQQNDVVIHSADELRSIYPDITVLALIPDMRLSEKKGYYYSSYYGDGRKEAK
jgi:Capsular polysaccharide biosynthesis protein